MHTDVHSHVIWGVDDGAKDRAETFRMLREAVEDGIRTIICTPHMMPGIYAFPEETFQEHLQEAAEFIRREQLPLRLLRGAEILYTDHVPRMLMEGRIPTMAGSNLLLVEFSPADTLSAITNALQRISGLGYVPVIAHMERYPAIRRKEQVTEIKNRFRALVQINAGSLIHRQPLLRRRYFDDLFRENLVDFVATDTHALPGRGSCMAEGIKALRRRYGEDVLKKLRSKQDMFDAERELSR